MAQSHDEIQRAEALADRVTYGVLTALPKEYAAMRTMLDGPVCYRAPGRGAAHDYELGEVPAKGGGTHVVALALGDQGNSNAAVHATTLLSDFRSMTAIVMVGIAGGVPHPAKAETHVRLGDIVVSGENGVVKYDFVKEHAEWKEARHPPRPPSETLRHAARRLQTYERTTRPWVKFIDRAKALNVSRPDPATDKLADTQDPTRWIEHPDDQRRRPDEPRVFEGTIGAADSLQKSAVRRDSLRDQFSIRAIEMEGFGVAEATNVIETGFFVVRGICDYCDSNKNDAWQEYAAIVAAAYARALLEETSESQVRVSALSGSNRLSSLSGVTRDPAFTSAPAGLSGGGPGLRVGLPVADPAVEREHQAHLDSARVLLIKGHAGLALEQLAALKARIWHDASSGVRARVLSMIGYAEFELGRLDAAGNTLVAALAENQTDSKILANGALGHALLGNVKAAIEWANRALSVDTTNMVARQVLIQQDERCDDEILAEHEAIVGKRVEVCFALGHRAARQNDAVRSARWFDAAMEIDGSDPDIMAAAGRSVVERVVQGTADGAQQWDELGVADTEALRRAEDLIQKAWDQLKDEGVKRSRVHWLVSLGMVRRLLGDLATAATRGDEALRIAGRTTELVRFRAAVAADALDNEAVVRLLSDADQDDPEVLGLLGTAEANMGHFEKAASLWSRLVNFSLPETLREQAERNQVFTLIQGGKPDDARRILAKLLSDNPTLARHLIAIEAAGRLGDHALRDELMEKAVALATRNASPRLLRRLGDTLMDARRPGDAANIYALVIKEPEAHERDGRRLVTALYRAGRFDSALAICRRIAASGRMARFCTEIESVILEELGDLAGARAVCERYLAGTPEDIGIRVRLATVSLRASDQVRLSELIAGVPIGDAVADLEVGCVFAQLLLEAGLDRDALETMFELRRRHVRKPQAHLFYIGHQTLLARQDVPPTRIERNVAVRLTGPDAPKEWTLITDEPSDDARGEEIRPSDPLAQALIGKCVGETVTFELAPHRSWLIAEISSKYVFAYRQSLSQFGRRFPDDGRLEQHEIAEDTNQLVVDLKTRLAQGEPRRQQILDMYGVSGSFTLGAVGTALERGPSESLGIVLASPHGLIASSNTADEKRRAALALENESATLVADYSALSVLSELGMLEDALSGRKVVVSQTTIDAFAQELVRWKAMPDDGFMSLGVRDGELLRHVLESDDVARARARYAELLAWIRARCAVLPITPRIIEQHADKRGFGQTLGQCFWDSVLLAAEPDRVLLSDDLKLRRLGQSLVGANGVASVHLLLAQRKAGRIDAATCATALVRLVLAGYKHVATDASMLEAAARLERWSPLGAFQRVLETLKGPDTDAGSALAVGAEFLRVAWFALLLPQQRDALCLAVIDSLVAGRSAKDVLSRLRHAVTTMFRLLPAALEDMSKLINLWSLMRLER